MKRFRIALAVFAAAILLLLGPVIWHLVVAPPGPPRSSQGLPWNIERLPDGGTRVMGLEPGRSALGDAIGLWPQGLTLGLMSRGEEAGSIEAFAESMSAGELTGKAILSALAEPALVEAMRGRSPKHEVTASGARRFALSAPDEAVAWKLPIRLITFAPTARLEADVVTDRFGPATPVMAEEGVRHYFYEDRGLVVTLDAKGRAFLQYVHPRDFAWLRARLSTSIDAVAH